MPPPVGTRTTTTAPINDEQPPTPARQTWVAIVRRAALLFGILAFVFVVVLPRVVQYDAVLAALRTLSGAELAAMVAATAVAFAANAGPARALVPAVSWPRSIAADVAGRAVVSTIPGPTDIATKFVLYRQWAIPADTAVAGMAFAGFFELLATLALPAIAFAAIVLTGDATHPNTLLIAVIGMAIFVGAVVVLTAIVRSEGLARSLGTALDRLARRIWPVFRKRPPPRIVDRVLRLRARSKDILSRNGVRAMGAALVASLGWFMVLEVALWSVGSGPDVVPPSVVLTAMAAVGIVALIPITPGAVGVAEIAYIGILSAVTGPARTDQITAAIVLFRTAQWLAPIPIGWVLLLVLRRGHWGEILTHAGAPAGAAVDDAAIST